MHCFCLFATMVVLSPIVIQAAQKRFMLEIHNLTCQRYTNHIKDFECGFKKVEKGRFLLTARIMTDRNFGQDTDVHALVRITPWKGQRSYNLVDMKLNLCVATSQGFSSVLLKRFFNEYKRTSNFPASCLFKGNFMYHMQNFSMTDEFIPAYAPYLNATQSLEFIQNNKIIATYILIAELIPKK